MVRLEACYTVRSCRQEIEARADLLALEQSAELPREALSSASTDFIRESVAAVTSIEPLDEHAFRVTLAFPERILDSDPAVMMNLLFGNSSLQEDVRLTAVRPCDEVLEDLGGPRYGIDSLRKMLDAWGRPLTATALKPVGLGAEDLGALCETFARAGIDIIKDDHSLADHAHCRFEDRVAACMQAVERGQQRGGRRSIYVPNLIGSPGAVLEQIDIARRHGVEAVMIAPMLLGLPFFHEVVKEELEGPVLAHPSLAGSMAMAPEALLGQVFRLLGADAVIFPHSGGRFAFSEKTCFDLAHRLREPWGSLAPAFPTPAGGLSIHRVAEIKAFYGPDMIMLTGGSLHVSGPDLLETTRDFVLAVASPMTG